MARLSPDQALALDFALGILIEPLLCEAARRSEAEHAFARLVAGYRAKLEAADDVPEPDGPALVMPMQETWAAIAQRTGIDPQG